MNLYRVRSGLRFRGLFLFSLWLPAYLVSQAEHFDQQKKQLNKCASVHAVLSLLRGVGSLPRALNGGALYPLVKLLAPNAPPFAVPVLVAWLQYAQRTLNAQRTIISLHNSYTTNV